MGRPRKVVPLPQDPEEDRTEGEDPEDDDQGESGIPWEEELRQWEMENNQERGLARLVIYRRLDRQGPTPREKVWEYMGEIPGSHEIGLQHGGGKFTAYLFLPAVKGQKKPRIKTRHFVLADSYTVERARRLKQEEKDAGQAPTNPGAPVTHRSLSDMEIMAFTIDRIVAPLMKAAEAKGGGGAFKEFSGMQDILGEVMANSARQQLALVREVTKEIGLIRTQGAAVEKEEEMDGDEAEDVDWKDLLKGFIKEHGADLLEMTGLKQKLAAAALKRNPVVQEVFQTFTQNKPLYQRVLDLLLKDPDVDRNNVEKMLAKLADMGVGVKLQYQPAPAAGANGTAAEASARG